MTTPFEVLRVLTPGQCAVLRAGAPAIAHRPRDTTAREILAYLEDACPQYGADFRALAAVADGPLSIASACRMWRGLRDRWGAVGGSGGQPGRHRAEAACAALEQLFLAATLLASPGAGLYRNARVNWPRPFAAGDREISDTILASGVSDAAHDAALLRGQSVWLDADDNPLWG